jgi:anti-sigma factor RsiW
LDVWELTMMDRDIRVTTDELHAYVDGLLPADRRDAVEAWIAAHPDDAAQIAEWRAQAAAIRERYDAIAAQPAPVRFSVDRLLHSERGWRGIAAAAAVIMLVAFAIGGVVGWFAHIASAASPDRFDTYTTEALDAHKLYVVEVRHPVEVPGSEREHLTQWLSRRLDYELQIPELDAIGLKLVGGRLLPGPFGPAAFYMYEGSSGDRYTLYTTVTGAPLTAMRYKADEGFAAFYWVERDLAFVLSGPAERERLQSIAQATYDQVDKGPVLQR